MRTVTAKGQHVTMTFDGHSLLIERPRWAASMAGGHTQRRIPVSGIVSYNFKKAGALLRGHFQVLTSGGHAVYDQNPATRGSNIASDPNAAVFPKKANADFEALAAAITKRSAPVTAGT